jgi:hypothetical protein
VRDDDQNPGFPDRDGAVQDVADCPMFNEPYAPVSGVGRTLTPLEFFDMTFEARTGADDLGDDFGLFEEPCLTVGKDGVEIHKQKFWHPDLGEYTTGTKKVQQRFLVLRYDQALAARGVLEEVHLLEKDDQGRYDHLMVLTPNNRPEPQWSRDLLAHQINARMAALVKKRDGRQDSYTRIVGGLERQEQFAERRFAQERNQRNIRPAPTPAAPIYDGEDNETDSYSRLSEQLAEADALVGVEKAPMVSRKPEETPSVSLYDSLTADPAMADAPVPAEKVEPEDKGSAGLTDLLGGPSGFRKRKKSS